MTATDSTVIQRALELLAPSPEAEISEVLARSLLRLGTSLFVSVLQPAKSGEMICRAFAAAPSLLERTIALIGRSPVGLELPLAFDLAGLQLRSGLQVVPGGLHGLLSQEEPGWARWIVEHAEEVGAVHVSGLVWQDQLFGAVILAQQPGAAFAADRVESLLQLAALVLQRHVTEAALRESEERYRTLFRNSVLAVGLRALDGSYLEFNEAYMRMLGYSNAELAPLTTADITHPDDVSLSAENMRLVAEGRAGHRRYEKRYLHKSGAVIWGDVCIQPLLGPDGKPVAIIGTVTDITERKKAQIESARLEEQLRQAQKLESIGRLAGGVAHDFNNILTGIIGHIEILTASLPVGDPMQEDLQEIRQASERAASLTAQLLAFSRKQIIAPRVLDLNKLLQRSVKMIRRLIGEDIKLQLIPAESLGHVKVDPNQVDQVLFNLAANARDAMLGGGELVIETADVVVDEAFCRAQAEASPGRYVMLSVSDSGCGISAEVLGHIFEPFFTTKDRGKGTGLGLSTVYGIIKQNNGFISVRSSEGEGTVFQLFWPRVEERLDSPEPSSPALAPRGTETILLVEDDDLVRTMAQRVLKRDGYRVLTAASAEEALELMRTRVDSVDLLLTDIVLPAMNGRQLHEELLKIGSRLKVLYMSGYSEQVIAHSGTLDVDVHFLPKPFSLEDLLRKIRVALES